MDVAEAPHLEAEAELERASLNYRSQIDGVNTAVASSEAQLAQARYYLDNTTLVAPEDGRIVNLQVRPGMVSGIYRIGGIAALIADADRYLLATYFQENLKYVRPASRSKSRSTSIPARFSGAASTASGRPMAWGNICRATRSRNSIRRTPTSRRASTG